MRTSLARAAVEVLESRRLLTAGDLDTTFDGDGKVLHASGAGGSFTDVAVQTDGKVVTVGQLANNAGTRAYAVFRYDANGTPDTSFGGGDGVADLPWTPEQGRFELVVHTDGRIILGGAVGGGSVAVGRLTAAGLPDTTFFNTGFLTESLTYANSTSDAHLAVQPDGKILLAIGSGMQSPGNVHIEIKRYNTGGGPDQTFHITGRRQVFLTGTAAWVTDLAVQNGRILLSGIDQSNHMFLARRLVVDGSMDSQFGSSGLVRQAMANTSGTALTILPDNSFYVAGTKYPVGSTSNGNPLLARFTAAGELDTTFGGGDGVVIDTSLANAGFHDVVVQSDGKPIVVTGPGDFILQRYLHTGEPDANFGTNGRQAADVSGWDGASDVALAPDGKIIVAGFVDDMTGGGVTRHLNDVGAISAGVYHDANGNGRFDAGEPATANRTVYLDLDNDGTLDLGEPSALSSATGAATFPIVSAGEYFVRQVLPFNWVQSEPQAPGAAQRVPLDVGMPAHVMFGSMEKGKLTGVVFNDADGDGVKDAGETTSNVLAFAWLDLDNDGVREAGEPAAQSNGFTGIFTLQADPGTYVLRIERPSTSWVHSPGHASRAVTVPPPGGSVDSGVYGLYRGGTLQGLTWNDKNNDGINNGGTEGIITGRTVYIDANDNSTFDTGELSAVSGPNGYNLVGVPIGTHVVRQVVPADWLHTAPGGTGAHSVTVASSQTISGLSFGTRYNFATVYGTVFEDLDNDGAKETGEGPLVGWTGYLDANNNNFLDPGELSALSDANGIFRIDNVTAGTHQLRVAPQTSWDQTLPAGFGVARSVTVAAGQTDRTSVFGFWYDYNSISGTMFNDANANGVRDTGEGPLSGRTIYLDLNSDFALTNGEPTRVTDANGNYTFDRLLDGTYRVNIVHLPYWRQTPDLMSKSVQVVRGEHEVNVNFSAVQVGRATGQLFNDANGNGVQDSGETTYTGFGISAYLDLNGNGTWDVGNEPTSYTGGTGQFSFEQVPGTYTVRLKDLSAAGVRQTSPANNGGRTITIVAGQDVTAAPFGVQQLHAVSGATFNDADGNGTWDSGESAAGGRTVFVDANDDGALNAGESMVVTDGGGRYTFRLPSGTFRLRQVVPSGYQETGRSATNSSSTNTFASNGLVVVPTDSAWTPAPASPPAPSFNFGTRIIPVTRVYGFVIRDNNGNGVTDSGEPGNTPGDVVYVDANNNAALDAGESQYTTDANGWFFNLPSGTYTIRQSLPTGWVQTMPTGNAALTVNVPSTPPANPIHAGFFGRYLSPQTPFKGSPFAVGATPVTIQAEDYDLGGQGIAFNDTTATNVPGLYRPNEAVDIKSQASGQYRISDSVAGEWLEYTIDVASGGDYEMEFRVSHSDPNSKFHAEIDGLNVTGSLTVPDTNSFNTFASVKKTVALTAGRHVLRFAFDANAAVGYAGGFDWVKITKVTTPEPPPPPPPPGGTVTLNNTIAAYVRNGSFAGTNYGNDGQLVVKGSATSGNTREGYLRFDVSTLPSDPAQITNVKLRVWGRLSASGTGVNVAAYGVSNTSWSETAINWNTKPAAGSAIQTRTVNSTTGTYYEWDVTNLVKSARQSGQTQVSLALKATNNTDPQALFNSDDATSNKPQLVAQTSTTTPPPTPQAIIVDNDGLIVPEGGSKSFTVKLAAAPTSNVTVTISKQAGSDPDVTADKSTLTFTAANWNVAQTVTLAAAEDADTVQNQSFFSVASSGLSTVDVWAIESENDGPATEPTVFIGDSSTVRDGTYASQNFGTATELVVKKSANAGNTREAYLKFDFSTVESVTSAKLRINARLSDTSIASLLTQIYSVSNTSWSETGITWNNKPTTGSTLRGSFTVSGTGATWYEIDLTSFIQAEFAAGRKVVTLVLRNPSTSDAQTLIPSDETANAPQLIVG